jgi:DNA-binding transcriptional LysR family regulator
MAIFQLCCSNPELHMPKPLDATSLHLFVAVCEHGSIARAAAQAALVPSALSKRIAALEVEAGVPLLQRQRRGVVPTPAGEALLRQAREVLAAMDRMRVELGSFGRGVQGSVHVLASPSVLAERLPDDIATFLAAQSGIRVTLAERSSQDIVRRLHEGAADIGVMWDQVDLSGLQVLPYGSDRLCVALAPSHALARRPRVRFEETLDHDSVGVVPGGLVDTLVRRQAALLGRLPAQRIQVTSVDAACRIVAAGLGLAILPREAVAPHAGAGRLRLVKLDEPWVVRRFVLASRPAPLVSASARLLLDHLARAGLD